MNEDLKSQEHNQGKSMRQTVPYNFKKVLTGIMLVAVPVFVSCEKDNEKPNENGGNNQPQKHNVELRYGHDFNTQWQNISMDTLYKYNSDQTVDSIFMVLEDPHQFNTLSTSNLKKLRNMLSERHNINTNKIFGKGEMQLKNSSITNNPEIVRFFADTLKYTVTYRDAKSR